MEYGLEQIKIDKLNGIAGRFGGLKAINWLIAEVERLQNAGQEDHDRYEKNRRVLEGLNRELMESLENLVAFDGGIYDDDNHPVTVARAALHRTPPTLPVSHRGSLEDRPC